MKLYGTRFRKKGSVGVVTVCLSSNGSASDYDPKMAARAIRKRVQCDDSIKLLFITGKGDRHALLREFLEMTK